MKFLALFLLLPFTALGQLNNAVLRNATITTAINATGRVDWITIETNGYVAEVHVIGFPAGGTYQYGLGISNTFSGKESLRINLTSPGFDDTGTAAAIPRTVVGTQRLRLAYNQQTSPRENADANGVMLYFALSDYIHVNDTIVNATVLSGLYNVTPNSNYFANLTTTVTNLSAVAAPRVLAMWSQPDYFLSSTIGTGPNYKVSLVAFQYSGQQKRPVRAVKFWSMDAAGNKSPTNIVLNPVIDSTQTDAVPVIEFTNNVDCSGMVQGSVISNYAIVYPWWGPALNLSDNVNPPGSADYCPGITLCDKSGLWRGAYAVVDPAGNDTTGKALTNKVSQPTGTESTFLTIARALDACAQTNNTFNGSNTLGNCTVYVNPGTYDVFGGNFASYNHPITWTRIMGNPTMNWSNVFLITANNTLTGQTDLKLWVQNMVCKVTAFQNTFGQGYGDNLIDNCIVQTNTQSTIAIVSSFTNLWLRQTWFSGMRNFPNPSGNQANSWTKSRGCLFTSFDYFLDLRSTTMNPVLFIGNSVAPNLGNEQYGLVNDSPKVFDPVIWSYNKLMRSDGATVTVALGLNAILTKGAAFVQNVVEGTTTAGSALGLDVMFSASANEWCTNFLIWNNTVISKYHPPFNLSGFTSVSADHYMDANNIFASRELTLDVGNSNTSATNRWALAYSVGDFNNVSTSIPQGNTANPAGTELGFDGMGSYFDTTAAPASKFAFASNASAYGGTSAGNGDYHLTSASPIVTSYYTGAVFLPYDIEGKPRAATNAPGAYAEIH